MPPIPPVQGNSGIPWPATLKPKLRPAPWGPPLPIPPARQRTWSAIQERYSARPSSRRQSEAPDFEAGHASMFCKIAVVQSISVTDMSADGCAKKNSLVRTTSASAAKAFGAGRAPARRVTNGFVGWKLLLGCYANSPRPKFPKRRLGHTRVPMP